MSKQHNQQGSLLASLLIIMAVLTTIAFSLFSFTSSQYARTTRNTFSANALLVAEAGIEQSLFTLNQNASFTGYGEQVFFNDSTQGRGVFTTTVTTPGPGNAKVILATGKIYRHNSPATADPVSTRQVKVTVVGTSSEGYSVHSGPGGLILSGSANITNSEVYVNGKITLSGAARIGTNSQPLNIHVANQSCPSGSNPGATYPQVCSTGQPISTEWSTAIFGTVCATGQTSRNYPSGNPAFNILPGNGGGGLQLGCVAPPVAPPAYNKVAHVAAVSTTSAANNINYNCTDWLNPVGFVRTWPANLRLTGNANLASSCDLTINGNVYITGNLDIGGAAKIRVANSLGTTRPVVLVDGNITVGGSAQLLSNSSGTGIHFVSMRSAAACGANCTNVTGTELYNSQNQTTVTIGGAASSAGMIFQAQWGKLVLNGSGVLGSAVGQTIDLSGAGTVIFGTALSSGSATWSTTSYQQVFNQ